MIELQDVTFAYPANPDKLILKDVSLTFPEGQFISLIGKSGCGKSTILKLLTTQLHPQSGQILFHNRPILLGDVAYMPQKDLLLPWLSILENVLLSDKLDSNNSVGRDKALAWLERAGLAEVAHALPHQLSGGMRQRAAFVRTILSNRSVLLLDEPFGALDAFTQFEMQQWLLSLWQELNQTIIFITHNIEEAILLSHRIYLLKPVDESGQQEVQTYHIDLPSSRSGDIRFTDEFKAYQHRIEVAIHD